MYADRTKDLEVNIMQLTELEAITIASALIHFANTSEGVDMKNISKKLYYIINQHLDLL